MPRHPAAVESTRNYLITSETFTFGTVVALVPINTVALSQITRPVTRTLVGARGRNVFGLGDPEHDRVRPEIVVVHGQEPPARVQVLRQRHVHGRRIFLDGFGRPATKPVVQPAALDQLGEVVLGDAGRHVPPTVHGEVRSPRQRQVEPHEHRLFVVKLQVPEMVRVHVGTVRGAEAGDLQDRRPLVPGVLPVQIVLVVGHCIAFELVPRGRIRHGAGNARRRRYKRKRFRYKKTVYVTRLLT